MYEPTQDMKAQAVSIPDAATALSVGRTTVYGLMSDGRLRSIRIGRRRVIPVAELKRFVTAELNSETPS